MADPLNRRDFIKSTSLAGLSFALSGNSAGMRFTSVDRLEIRNRFFTVSFNKKAGTFSVVRGDGNPFLTDATAAVNFSGNGASKRLLTAGSFQFTAHTLSVQDAIGRGVSLVISGRDTLKVLNVELSLSLYDEFPIVIFQATCRNISQNDMLIHSLEPLRVLRTENSFFHMTGISKCLTNGEMYFDAGVLHTFGKTGGAMMSGDLKGVQLANGAIDPQTETIHSWWNAGLFAGHDQEGVALGYCENTAGLGNLLLARTAADQLSFVCETVYAPQLTLKPGATIGSNRVMVVTAQNAFLAMERYATIMSRSNNARTGSVLNGWCSWFYTLSRVSEAEVLANTAFAAQHLKPFGLEYIQVDEGYQRWHGEWEGNDRFPHGMKWLADQIRSHGFKAGLWISPYVISEPTLLYKEHPEWLLQRLDGSLQRVGNWEEGEAPPPDENPKRYGLDITHPGAARWLHDLIDTIVNDWGYEMIKIDFVAWSILAAERYHDPSLSSAEVYRRGMKIMREAAGDKCHILECGPGAITTGLIDSMRIEADVNYGFHEAAWDTYFTHPAGSASAAAKRYYFHKRTWINDADHLCMDLLTHGQSEAAATLIALSGGNMFSGDRLTELDGSKLDILKKITPSYAEAAIPLDLFDQEMQSVFAMKIEKPFGKWIVLAVFNPGLTEPVTRQLSAAKIGLDPEKIYVAFDFWKQQLFGEVKGNLEVTVQPGSVMLITLHERSGRPQFISTDRHFSQGGLEIEDVRWDESTRSLSVISMGPVGSSHHVFLYVPDELEWTWNGSALYKDHDHFSLKLVDRHLVRAYVHFDTAARMQWEFNYDEFLK